MRCDAASPLTVLTLAVVTDKSLYEHIPQCLINRLSFDCVLTPARVAGVQVYILNVRLNSYGSGV